MLHGSPPLHSNQLDDMLKLASVFSSKAFQAAHGGKQKATGMCCCTCLPVVQSVCPAHVCMLMSVLLICAC